MQISLESKFYCGLNFIVGAVSLYKTPHPFQWLTAFAVGLLVGSIRGAAALRSVTRGYEPGNRFGMGWSQTAEDDIRQRGVNYLLNSMPGILTTAINCISLAIITKSADFIESYGSRFQPYVSGVAAFSLGYSLGHIFSLDKLRKSNDPAVAPFISNIVV